MSQATLDSPAGNGMDHGMDHGMGHGINKRRPFRGCGDLLPQPGLP